jgi:hypothetical protein
MALISAQIYQQNGSRLQHGLHPISGMQPKLRLAHHDLIVATARKVGTE